MKTEIPDRKIDLGPAMMGELKKWKVPCPTNELDLVFPNQAGNPINKDCKIQNAIKKGLTTFDSCKPMIFVVGTIGFEPTTSTVSR